MKGVVPRDQDWEESVDLFFYRTQDEVIKMQEKEKQKNKDDNENVNQTNQYYDDGQQYIEDDQKIADTVNIAEVEQPQQEVGVWEDQPPDEMVADDDGWGDNNQGNVDFDTW